MNRKKLLSLILAAMMSLSTFTALAEDVETATDAVTEEVVVTTEEESDILTEEIVAMPDDGDDGSIDYADMSNWAYWNEGENKKADLFFICPTVDMGKNGNFVADIEN